MRIPIVLLIFLFLPALVAFGHDVYLMTSEMRPNQHLSIDYFKEEFKLSAYGFIWTKYHPESFKTIVQSLDDGTRQVLASALSIKAVYGGLGFGLFFCIIFTILAIFGMGPFAKSAHDFNVPIGHRSFGKGAKASTGKKTSKMARMKQRRKF